MVLQSQKLRDIGCSNTSSPLLRRPPETHKTTSSLRLKIIVTGHDQQLIPVVKIRSPRKPLQLLRKTVPSPVQAADSANPETTV